MRHQRSCRSQRVQATSANQRPFAGIRAFRRRQTAAASTCLTNHTLETGTVTTAATMRKHSATLPRLRVPMAQTATIVGYGISYRRPNGLRCATTRSRLWDTCSPMVSTSKRGSTIRVAIPIPVDPGFRIGLSRAFRSPDSVGMERIVGDVECDTCKALWKRHSDRCQPPTLCMIGFPCDQSGCASDSGLRRGFDNPAFPPSRSLARGACSFNRRTLALPSHSHTPSHAPSTHSSLAPSTHSLALSRHSHSPGHSHYPYYYRRRE